MILDDVSVDCVIFGFDGTSLKVLLHQINRKVLQQTLPSEITEEQISRLYDHHPGMLDETLWNLFAAHVPVDQDLDAFALDLVRRAIGLKNVYLQQIEAFGAAKRVPYTRVITVGYYALINPAYHDLRKSAIAKTLQWFNVTELPPLCFDHAEIIRKGLEKLRWEAMYQPVGFHLLPEKFTLTEFQTLYEVLLNKKLDTRNFRKKISKMNLLIDTNEKQKNVAHRAAKLYQFDMANYNRLKKEGLNFRIE
jgi:8-oxo-dGTP diphosphatase